MINFSIIIPAYNEEEGIGLALTSLMNEPYFADAEVIVVDDGSSDGTSDVVKKYERVKLIHHRINKGQGSSLATGIRKASGQYVLWFDSDGQHRVADLVRIAQALEVDDLDYCVGVRTKNSHQVMDRKLGKYILRKVVDWVAQSPVRDFNSGLRGFRTDIIRHYVHLFPKRFGASTFTTLLMIKLGWYGDDVEIQVERRIGKSSVKVMRDGLNTLTTIIRVLLLFAPLQLFANLGFFFIFIGSVYGLIRTFTEHLGFPVLGSLVIILGVQSLFFGLLSDQIRIFLLGKLE